MATFAISSHYPKVFSSSSIIHFYCRVNSHHFRYFLQNQKWRNTIIFSHMEAVLLLLSLSISIRSLLISYTEAEKNSDGSWKFFPLENSWIRASVCEFKELIASHDRSGVVMCKIISQHNNTRSTYICVRVSEQETRTGDGSRLQYHHLIYSSSFPFHIACWLTRLVLMNAAIFM